MSQINIEAEPFSTTKYYSGTYTDKDDNDFDFTLCVDESEIGYNDTLVITWVDSAPVQDEKEVEAIEEQIKSKWNESDEEDDR